MATIDILNLQPQQISKDLRGKFILLYGLPFDWGVLAVMQVH